MKRGLTIVQPVAAEGEKLASADVEALGRALGEALAAQFLRENMATENRMDKPRSGFGQQEDRNAD